MKTRVPLFRQNGPWLYYGAIGVIAFVAAWRFLVLKGEVPLDGNMITISYPNWVFGKGMLTSGHWPLWNPFRDMGEPFWADPQSFIAYPLTWILSPLQHFSHFLLAWYFLHSVLAAVFYGRLAYHYEPAPLVALTGALLGTLNGYFLGHLIPNVFATAAWVPAVIYFTVRRSAVGTGTCFAAQWLAGSPDFTLLTVALVSVLFLREGREGFKRLVGAGCLPLGLSSYQFIPFLDYFFQSGRALILSPTHAIQFSIAPKELLKMFFVPQWTRFSPELSGDPALTAFYMGVPAFLLALWALYKGGRRERMIGGGVLVLILSLGSYVPGFQWFRILHVFCYPAHWLLLATLGLTLLVAFGMAKLPKRFRPWLLGLIVLDLVAMAQVPRIAWIEPHFLTTQRALAERLRAFPYPVRIYHAIPFRTAWHQQDARTVNDFLRYHDFLAPSLGMAFMIGDVESHQVLLLNRTAQFLKRLEKEGPESSLLKDAGIAVVATIKRGGRGIEDALLVDIKSPRPPLYVESGSANAQVRVKRYRPGFVEADITLKGPDTLVLNQVSATGWSARVDGQERPVTPYLNTFVGVAVPPGSHAVEFLYEPRTFLWGWIVTLFTLIVLLGYTRGIRFPGRYNTAR